MDSFWKRLHRRLGPPPAVHVDLASYGERLAAISHREEALGRASDLEVRALGAALRERVLSGADPGALEVEAFALVREAARRTLGQRPFDVQVLAALALSGGNVVEMGTGEGKTLAAVFPAWLHALGGRGVHVLTFNDYLARRDAAWMGPVYEFLGVSARALQDGMSPAERRRAYGADVTYVTAKQAGFDLLRDGRCTTAGDLVHRPFHFALVDEADSLLIDEARVPLVLAGAAEERDDVSLRMAEITAELVPGRDYGAVDYGRGVELTEAGLRRVEEALGCSLHAAGNQSLLGALHCAVHARALLRRDVDYIVRDGTVQLVDELTGRVVEDRQWPDGLQAALEAREGLRRRPDGRVLGTLTLQHFFRLYPRLCGMTGTARSAAEELRDFYGLEVVVIPPNRPSRREDLPDRVYTHRAAKTRALVAEVRAAHDAGRPVLIGTLTVAESEDLAHHLGIAGIPCQVLNAKTDEAEAHIIARAGLPGAVTISTNMAGRGADIRLGGPDERHRDRVVELGGLYVLGTNRHESVRIDDQLRGRAGRQGDPGTTRFFISLEDDLMVRYRLDRLIPPHLWPQHRDEPLDAPVVRREIARAQRIIEGQNFEIRRALLRYSEVVERQRRKVDERRRRWLRDRPEPDRFAARLPELHAAVCREHGRQAADRAERQVTLFHIDRLWSEHLQALADLREGVHLMRVAGADPLTEFLRRGIESFRRMERQVDEDVVSTLRGAVFCGEGVDLGRAGLARPASTWTYLADDDPLYHELALQFAGNTGFAAAAALYTGPLLLLWGLYDRYVRRRGRRLEAPGEDRAARLQ